MNERIRELINEATSFKEGLIEGKYDIEVFDKEKFAELIIKECVAQCRQEWYDLNNAESKENETSRDIGIRVGQKNGVLKTISRIKDHFGIEERPVPILTADEQTLFSGIASSQSFTVEGAKRAFGVHGGL